MELHCTLVTTRKGHDRVHHELVIEAGEGLSGSEVAEAIEREFGVSGITVNGLPLAALTVNQPPLRSGAVLLAGEIDGHRDKVVASAGLSLAVRSGPAAGTIVPLSRGAYRMGRGDGEDAPAHGVIALPDPQLSRIHAELRVTDTGIQIIDRGSANGIWVEGRRLLTADLVSGQRVRVGSSEWSLEFPGEVRLDQDAGGPLGEALRVPREAVPQRTTAMLATALLPLVLGLGLALTTGQWLFLAFSGVSALTLLVPLTEARSARRKHAARVADAVAQDAARRVAAAPDAAELCMTSGEQTLALASRGDVEVRLGTAALPAHVIIEPEPPSLPTHSAAPLTLHLAGVVALRGDARAIEGLIRFLLLQLASLPAAAHLTVVLAGGSRDLRLAARFMPRMKVLSDAETAHPSITGAALDTTATVVVLAPGVHEAIVASVRGPGARVVCIADATGTLPPDSVVDLGAAAAELRVGDRQVKFAPDLVPQRPFEAAARRLGLRGLAHQGTGPPHRIRLGEVINMTDDDLRTAWSHGPPRQNVENIRVTLGWGAQGATAIDLVSDGPHFLVAGTTGSGKSELLRTLVASAAAAHSPARLTFLLVDFKGGSGLEPLSELPHCVGLVTDLGANMQRTLVSLRAELKRRERLLAESRCADIVDYGREHQREPLPRLAIVVDEFRMLVDDAPESLAELLRVATIGRSLGLHLVLATQRPRGAITADIRANIGSTIALRVTSEDESRDVLGSPAAAHIPSELPGRALLSVNGREPVEFQIASLTLASATQDAREVRLIRGEEWLRGEAASPREKRLSPAEAAQSFVSAARNAWLRDWTDLPRRPVAEPLPKSVGPAPVRGHDIWVGVGDYPHEQRTALVSWNPEEDGHFAAIGTCAGGAGTVLTSVVEQLATAGSERHLYLLDGDGSLGHLSGHARVGAHAELMDLRLAAKIVERIMAETAGRANQAPVKERSVILVVSAWGSWIASFRQSPQAWAEERLLDLIREGAARGVRVVVSGERELTSSRAFGSLPCRMFFPYGATDESMLGWPVLPPGSLTFLRAIATGALSREGPIAVQCFTPPGPHGLGDSTSSQAAETPRPFRITPPPKVVRAAEIGRENRTRRSGRRGQRQGLAMGRDCDDRAPLILPLRAGEILLVLGAPRTGKTSLLEALPAMNPAAGPWFHIEGGPAAAGGVLGDGGGEQAISTEGAIVLVDNADRLTPADSQRLSAALDAGAMIVATADVRPGLYTRCPLALHGAGGRAGIVLAPQFPSDGDVFGVRLEPLGQVPPGRAVAIMDGRLIEVQLGWLDAESSSLSERRGVRTSSPGRFSNGPLSRREDGLGEQEDESRDRGNQNEQGVQHVTRGERRKPDGGCEQLDDEDRRSSPPIATSEQHSSEAQSYSEQSKKHHGEDRATRGSLGLASGELNRVQDRQPEED